MRAPRGTGEPSTTRWPVSVLAMAGLFALICFAIQAWRLFSLSASYDQALFREGDALLFGPETRGLPAEVLSSLPPERRLRLPMREGNRSLNLSNAAAVVVYEAWRQLGFAGGS